MYSITPCRFSIYLMLILICEIGFGSAVLADSDEVFFDKRSDKFNCYSYALGHRCSAQDVRLRPGAIAGNSISNFTPINMKNAIIADGARLAGEDPEKIPSAQSGQRLIAAFISPSEEPSQADFHFYRLEPDGYWSHKPGRGFVTHLDADGRPIRNPFEANRDYRKLLINGYRWPYNYRIFVGYFYVPIKSDDCHTSKKIEPSPDTASPSVVQSVH